MPFTVTRSPGMTAADFIWYSRRLSQQGKDLGRLPRILEPETGRHWLVVFEDRTDAVAFAETLASCTGRDDWAVLETNGSVSIGPLGPVLIHVSREGNARFVATNPLSRALLRSAFPDAIPVLVRGEIGPDSWAAYHAPRADLAELIWELAPILTGVSLADLDDLGYVLLDDDTRETILAIPPALAPAHA